MSGLFCSFSRPCSSLEAINLAGDLFKFLCKRRSAREVKLEDLHAWLFDRGGSATDLIATAHRSLRTPQY